MASGPRPVRAPRDRADLQELADRGGAAHADEQPRSRGGRATPTTSWCTAAPAGRPARGTRSTPSVARCATLDDDETMLVQSGKPVGVFRTHEWAPRVLIANSNLVPEWANWERVPPPRGARAHDVRPDDGRLVDLHRHPGDPPGHLRVLRRDRPAPLRRHARRHDHAHRRARRDGRRPAAGGHDERRRGAVHRRRRRPHRAARRAPLPRRGRRLARRRGRPLPRGARRAAARCRSASSATRPTLLPALVERDFPADIVTDQTSAHDPLGVHARRPDARRRRPSWRATDPEELDPPGPAVDGRRTARRWSPTPTRAPRCSTTATACAPRPSSAASSGPSTIPGSCRRTSDRCSARARGRSAGWRCRAIRPTSRPPTGPCSRSSPTTRRCTAGSRWPASGWRSRACRRRICWLGYGERHRLGLRFNEMVRTGEVSAPIVIGRDHLDSGLGGVAVPRDRGDGRRVRRDRRLAAAQRARQHGERGDVGEHPPRRRRRHRPFDPRRHGGASPTAPTWPRRSSSGCCTTDPGMGVIRHVDAGYERAVEVAAERGVRIPMAERAVTSPIDVAARRGRLLARRRGVRARGVLGRTMVALAERGDRGQPRRPVAERQAGERRRRRCVRRGLLQLAAASRRCERFIAQSPAADIAAELIGRRRRCGCTTTTCS